MDAIITPEVRRYILRLREEGLLDPMCDMCQKHFMSKIVAGAKMYEILAPPHKPKDNCASGKHPHCSCDICF